MPEAGDLIGPYRLVSELGKGAMGEVWRARDERLDRYVALKVLPADLAGDLERRARMLREARAAAAIRHANVVTLFDIVEHRGDDILVMELIEGRTLSETLRKDGAPALEVALRWIEGVADALVAAHARGILHRDIKAANIMVTADGGVKVLDFGLAKLASDPTMVTRPPPVRPPNAHIELDATMPSGASGAMPIAAGTRPSHAELASYRTHAGQLLGTPLYMAPEQIAGELPDERSEVFSVGVLAHEILAGKPPYTASTMDDLFRQIANDPPPPLDVPAQVAAIVTRALAKDPAARWPSMTAFRDAIAAERRRLFAPRRHRWLLLAAAAVVLGGGFAGVWWLTHRAPPARPGDEYVTRALEEYDVFYNEKSLSSLRAALRITPDHPRANAYMILFGGASEPDRNAALAAAQRAQPQTDEHSKDRALLDAAIAFATHGPAAARTALTDAAAPTDRELAFWAAELDYRASRYTVAHDAYKALLAEPAPQFRGRIYDHYAAVLLYLDEPDEALKIGTLYRDAFPGEADAVGVYATTLAAAGRLPDALAAAEEALRLNEGEDTLAGLAKVAALAGDHARARELYQRSLDRAGPNRRPLRRAALGLLEWIDGDVEAAKLVLSPCLADPARERGPCLFVGGLVDPQDADRYAAQLDELAAAKDGRPPYGAPASLAKLVRARTAFFGGGCLVDPKRPDVATPMTTVDDSSYTAPLDFYAAYHVPYFATYPLCERAALLAAHGDRSGAKRLLDPVAHRAPGRTWLVTALKAYE